MNNFLSTAIKKYLLLCNFSYELIFFVNWGKIAYKEAVIFLQVDKTLFIYRFLKQN